MKALLSASLALVVLTASVGYAGSLEDANAGLAALDRGDNATAVRLFTQALHGGLSESDRELALVKRAQAYIGEKRNDLALADLQQALKLDPGDQEAANLRLQAQGGAQSDHQTGLVTATYSNGDHYEGAVRNGKPNGRGAYVYASGDHYEGDWVDGNRTGRGVYVWANGDHYEGDWVDGKRTGRGAFTYANGVHYEGGWRDDKQNGRGFETWPNGARYQGEWRDNVPNGVGQLIAGGDSFNGIWTNGCFWDGVRREHAGVDGSTCP